MNDKVAAEVKTDMNKSAISIPLPVPLPVFPEGAHG